VHPDTGQPYVWPEDSLLDTPLAQLPGLDEAAAMAWLELR
jgi:hypothetical protein